MFKQQTHSIGMRKAQLSVYIAAFKLRIKAWNDLILDKKFIMRKFMISKESSKEIWVHKLFNRATNRSDHQLLWKQSGRPLTQHLIRSKLMSLRKLDGNIALQYLICLALRKHNTQTKSEKQTTKSFRSLRD